jgi:hypothetical protein
MTCKKIGLPKKSRFPPALFRAATKRKIIKTVRKEVI